MLTGRVNPSGKCAETWYQHLSDSPTAPDFPSYAHEALYREGPYVGYRYCQTAGVRPAYPFGFGLSYTTFAYDGLQVELPADLVRGAGTRVRVTLTNTGACAGAEVVQLYVAKPKREVFRPTQELKAFGKVFLQPGESRELVFDLDEAAFRYWNVETCAWEVEGGVYELRVGASSEDIRLTGTVALEGTCAPNPYAGVDMTPYETGRVAHGQVSDAQFAALLGRPIPYATPSIDENLRLCELTHARSLLLAGFGAALDAAQRKSLAGPSPDLRVAFTANMPLRALAQLTGGVIDRGVVRALIREAKGWGLAGAVPAAVALWRGKRARTAALLWAVWAIAPITAALVADVARNAAGERTLEVAARSREQA